MISNIVLLYVSHMFGLPNWCRMILWISIWISIFKFLYGIYTAGKQSEIERG